MTDRITTRQPPCSTNNMLVTLSCFLNPKNAFMYITVFLTYTNSKITQQVYAIKTQTIWSKQKEGKKVKEVDLYSALLKYVTLKALRYGSHSVKPKVHYASWSETCSKPAGDLLAS